LDRQDIALPHESGVPSRHGDAAATSSPTFAKEANGPQFLPSSGDEALAAP